jgi:O-acetyl-ADP-ribose deacetylase (regulator of RNase III)
MITYATGDLLQADAEALVNAVNCVGVMGKGIALQFKRRYPDNFQAYERACTRDEVSIGTMFVTETGHFDGPRYVINFPTKTHWRGPSRLSYIDAGLVDLIRVLRDDKIRSVAIPPLGVGNGGLDWVQVERRLIEALQQVPGVRAIIYPPAAGHL